MFSTFKKIFGKRADSAVDSPSQLRPSAPASAPAPRAPAPRASRPEPTPRPVVVPANAPSHVSVPLRAIINRLPPDLMQLVRQSDVGDGLVAISMQKVLSQISLGAVKIPFSELRHLSPPGTFSNDSALDRNPVEIPLQEILSHLSPSLLPRRPSQKQVSVPPEVTGPFGGQAQITFSTTTLKPGPTAQSIGGPSAAPAPAPTPAPYAPPAPAPVAQFAPPVPPAPRPQPTMSFTPPPAAPMIARVQSPAALPRQLLPCVPWLRWQLPSRKWSSNFLEKPAHLPPRRRRSYPLHRLRRPRPMASPGCAPPGLYARLLRHRWHPWRPRQFRCRICSRVAAPSRACRADHTHRSRSDAGTRADPLSDAATRARARAGCSPRNPVSHGFAGRYFQRVARAGAGGNQRAEHFPRHRAIALRCDRNCREARQDRPALAHLPVVDQAFGRGLQFAERCCRRGTAAQDCRPAFPFRVESRQAAKESGD